MEFSIRKLPLITGYWLAFFFTCEGFTIVQPKSLTVEEGQSVALTCFAAADLPLDPNDKYFAVWHFKRNNSQSSDLLELGEGDYDKLSSRRLLISENFTLTIGVAELNDSGLYTCSLLNGSEASHTTDDDQTQLTVVGKPLAAVGQPVTEVLGPQTVSVKWSPLESSYRVSYKVLVRDRMDKEYSIDKEAETTCVVDNLLPNSEYQFSVIARNSVDEETHGAVSEWIRTAEDAPSGKVRIIEWKSFSDFLTIDFELPALNEWNGNLTGFDVAYTTGSEVNVRREFAVVGIHKELQTLNVSHLMPFTSYDIKIAVFNQAGTGPFSESIQLRTEEGVPSKPRILNIPTRNDTMLTVHWEQPEQANGYLLGYNLFWSSRTVHDSCQVHSLHTTHEITGLSPYTKYGIQVSAFTRIGSGPKSDPHDAITDVAAPGVPLLVNVSINQSDTVIVRWWRPQNFTKQIDMYHLRYRLQQEMFYKKLELKHLDTTQDFYEVPVKHLIPNSVYEFQVAAVTKSIFTDREYLGPYSEPLIIAISNGVASEEEEPKSNLLTLGIVCGVLCCLIVLGALMIFIISRHLIRMRYQFIADQDAGKQPVASLLLSEIYDPKLCFKESIAMENFRDHVAALHADGDYLLSQEYEEINRMTPTNSSTSQSCEEENKQKNRYLNILAYDHSRVLLNQLPGKPRQSDYINANFVNGYKQAKAFIATQGPLPSTFGDFWRMVWEQESSVIVMITNLTEKGRRKCDQYWPTEGEHHYDNVTVRLTNTRVTAHYTVRTFLIKHLRHRKRSGNERTVIQYHYTDWPDHGVPTFTLPSLTFIRKSSASSMAAGGGIGGGPVIVHCRMQCYIGNFLTKPPGSTQRLNDKSLLCGDQISGAAFVLEGLLLSAGVGRTGTYIVIDSMIKQIKDVQSVNIFGFLCHIRNHRNYLVQTEDQYSFIHDAILEYIESGDTEVKDGNISQYIKEVQTRINNGESLLEKQHKVKEERAGNLDDSKIRKEQLVLLGDSLLATSFVPKPYHLASALAQINEGKNRSNQYLPVEISRVCLPTKAGVDGSDYINATFLQGYSKNDEYIITQHPLMDTTNDFWHMVWDQNSVTIVLLSASDETDFKSFWPGPNETTDCGNFQVSFREEERINACISSREFILQSTQDDYECTVRMIEHPMWPESCSSMNSVYELVLMAKAWNGHHEDASGGGGPVIVVDRCGGTKAAMFCAIAMLSDQLHHEGCIDVYAVAKLYHMKRPGVFPSVDEYLFLYKVLDGIHGEMNNHCEEVKDSEVTNCNSCNTHLQTMTHSMSHNSVNSNHSVRNSVPA